jgi:hypothetical protein
MTRFRLVQENVNRRKNSEGCGARTCNKLEVRLKGSTARPAWTLRSLASICLLQDNELHGLERDLDEAGGVVRA